MSTQTTGVTLAGRTFTRPEHAISFVKSELFRPSLRDGITLSRHDRDLAQQLFVMAYPATDAAVPSRFFIRPRGGEFEYELVFETSTGDIRPLSIAKTIKKPFFVDRNPHAVLRFAVQGQLDRFRTATLTAAADPICPVSGKRLHRDGRDAVVDHAPIQFGTLRMAWAAQYGGIGQLQLRKTPTGYQLASARQTTEWQQWHAENAVLRCVHVDAYAQLRAEQARARAVSGGYPPMPAMYSPNAARVSAEVESLRFD